MPEVHGAWHSRRSKPLLGPLPPYLPISRSDGTVLPPVTATPAVNFSLGGPCQLGLNASPIIRKFESTARSPSNVKGFRA